MAVTARELIEMALLDAGIVGQGQTASAFDSANALTRLNWLLAQWRVKRWLVFRLRSIGLTSTGAQSYTVGPGGDFALSYRPNSLTGAFLRQLAGGVDTPLAVISAREDYDRISVKTLQGPASSVFYDSASPLGSVYPWPIPPASQYVLYLTVKEALVNVDNLADDLAVPEEYFRALHLSLAQELRTAYLLPPDPVLLAASSEAREVLRGANTQIPRLLMPAGVAGRGVYNPYSDRIN